MLSENNTFIDLPDAAQPDGNGFASFGSPRVSERISWSRNTYLGMFDGHNEPDAKDSYPHEVFTSDGTGGAYAGPLASDVEYGSTNVVLPKKADQTWEGAAVAVLSGPGAGQVRRVVSASGNTYVVDRPWDFTLQGPASGIGGSIITIVPYVGKIIMEGNLAKNSTTIQVFGSGFDSIYAGNTLEYFYGNENCHPAGLWAMAVLYGGGCE